MKLWMALVVFLCACSTLPGAAPVTPGPASLSAPTPTPEPTRISPLGCSSVPGGGVECIWPEGPTPTPTPTATPYPFTCYDVGPRARNLWFYPRAVQPTIDEIVQESGVEREVARQLFHECLAPTPTPTPSPVPLLTDEECAAIPEDVRQAYVDSEGFTGAVVDYATSSHIVSEGRGR